MLKYFVQVLRINHSNRFKVNNFYMGNCSTGGKLSNGGEYKPL